MLAHFVYAAWQMPERASLGTIAGTTTAANPVPGEAPTSAAAPLHPLLCLLIILLLSAGGWGVVLVILGHLI